MSLPVPQCLACRYFFRDTPRLFKCRAFPDGIPIEILTNEVVHTKPVAGDRGIQFAPAVWANPGSGPESSEPVETLVIEGE